MKSIPEPSISVPSWEGRGIVDAEVSSMKLVSEDMVGTKDNDAGDGAGRVKYGVHGRLVDAS